MDVSLFPLFPYFLSSSGGGGSAPTPAPTPEPASESTPESAPAPEPTSAPASGPEPQCDSEHLNLCTNQEICEGASLYWYDDSCHLGAKVATCTPNWQCTDWQPLPETIACGEIFTQTRTCTDLNNCGSEEEKPIEEQGATAPACD